MIFDTSNGLRSCSCRQYLILVMAEETEEGAVIREFAWVFETMSEITKSWKKDMQDSRFDHFLLDVGPARAIDLFYKLDKDQGKSEREGVRERVRACMCAYIYSVKLNLHKFCRVCVCVCVKAARSVYENLSSV